MSKKAIREFVEAGSVIVKKLGEAAKIQKVLQGEGIETSLFWKAQGAIEVRAA